MTVTLKRVAMSAACNLAGGHRLAGRGGGATKIDLRLRPAQDDGLWVCRGSVREASGRAVRRQAQDRPVPRRAARPGAGDAAEAALGRHRLHHHLHGQRLDRGAAGRRLLAALHLPRRGAPGQGRRRSGRGERVQGDDRRVGAGRACAGADHAGLPPHLRQDRDRQGRRPQGQEDPRAGDQDRGYALPGLWRADRAHALRRGLHQPADGRGELRRERRQRLPVEQALRGGAGAQHDRARGQQQHASGSATRPGRASVPTRRNGSRRPPPRSASSSRRTPSSSKRTRPRS